MGVEVLVGGATADEAAAVTALFDEWDRIFSRFRPESELSRVNRSRARLIRVSSVFAAAVETALAAAAATRGLVDPTLGARDRHRCCPRRARCVNGRCCPQWQVEGRCGEGRGRQPAVRRSAR